MTLTLAGLAGLFLTALLVPAGNFDFYTAEGGPVEIFSAAGYLTVLVALWREGGRQFVLRHPYFMLIPAAMSLRELDFHSRFTAMTITKTRFYISAEIPLLHKALAVMAIALLLWAFVTMARRHAAELIAGLRAGRAYAVALVIAAGLVVGSKLLDGIARKLATYGIGISSHSTQIAEALEEVMELGIPLFMLVALFAYFSGQAPEARGARP